MRTLWERRAQVLRLTRNPVGAGVAGDEALSPATLTEPDISASWRKRPVGVKPLQRMAGAVP